MEPRFQLRCLGEPVLIGPDGQPIRFKVRKHLALLVYLAVESKARHRREHLAELLWANLPEAEGRHSLATGLSMLRARFGRDVVESGREDLRWAYTRLDLDLDRLAAGSVLGDDVTPSLDVAGFLDGFEVPAAAEFMLWRERQRARWLPLVRDALIALMDRARRTGDSRQIEQLADRMLALDDLSEDAVRAKMEARAFAGDRLAALKIFEAWRERLDEELGAAPSPLVEGMALRLRKRGWERSAASPIPAVRTDQWKDRPFIGRGVEYRALYEGWERTQRGEAGHALVVGESGIGKSTLVERLATAAGLEGASVCRVQCYELEREIPYAAVGGLIRTLLDRAGASAVSPETLAELARTVPEVRRRFPHIPQAVESEGETARLRLAEAMHQLVSAVAEEHPLILVVDDHHLADDASLAVLHLIMRRSEGEPLMVVLIARPGEMGGSPQAARLKASLPRLGASAVELPPLTDAESDQLVGSLIPPEGPQPNGAVRRALVQAARGYPMVLELLCKDWQIHGERSLALALDAMTADPAPSGAPMEAYRQLHERIIESLDPVTRNVLNLSAILGHRLNDVTMYTLADLTVGQTMAGMSQLTTLRVLRDGGDGLEFINELIRAHAYVSVPSAVRRVLHGNIADRLIEGEQRGLEVQGLEVAWHCIRSGREAEAAPYLLKGARQAIQRGAPQEAERGLLTGKGILHGEQLVEGTLLLAEALQEQGQWAESLVSLESCPRCESQEDTFRSFVLSCLGRRFLGRFESDDSFQTVQQLIHVSEMAESERTRARALLTGSLISSSTKCARSVQSLLAAAEKLDVPFQEDVQTDVTLARALLYAHSSNVRKSKETLAPAVVTLRRKPGGMITGALFNAMGAVQCALGSYEDALSEFQAAYDIAVALGNESLMCATAGNASLCCARLGRYKEQVSWGEIAVRRMSSSYTGFRELMCCYYRAHGLAMLGQYDAAVDAINTYEIRLPSSIVAWQRQAWMLYKADVYQLSRRPRHALEIGRAAVANEYSELLAASSAGPYARWMALTSVANERDAKLITIEDLAKRLKDFDALDQLEVLCALNFLRGIERRKRGGIRISQRTLAERLVGFPPAVAIQLQLLGVLDGPASMSPP